MFVLSDIISANWQQTYSSVYFESVETGGVLKTPQWLCGVILRMTPTDVSRALEEANQSISNLLLAARKNSENLSDFVESGLGPSLGPAIGVIAKLLKDLQIGSLARLPSIKV